MSIIAKLKIFFLKTFNPEQFWISKWDKKVVKYKAQNKLYRDIRTLINYPSWIAEDVLSKIISKSNSINEEEKINLIMKWVHKNIKYKKDIEEWKSKEFWADSDIIFQKQNDDCDGYAIAFKTLTLAAGIPDWKVKVVAGYTKKNKGHAYCIYLNNKNQWVTADACWSDKLGDIPHKENKKYGKIWFTFSKEHTFSSSKKPIQL